MVECMQLSVSHTYIHYNLFLLGGGEVRRGTHIPYTHKHLSEHLLIIGIYKCVTVCITEIRKEIDSSCLVKVFSKMNNGTRMVISDKDKNELL